MLRRTACACVLAVLAPTVVACGGSGGGGAGGGGNPTPTVVGNGTFTGSYFAALLTGGHTAAGPQGRGTTGTLTADGAGHASHTQTINDGGVISGPTTLSYDFAVAPDGALELSLTGTVFARGGIASDGRMAVLASVIPGAFPGIIVLLRREGLHGPASLFGDYHRTEVLFATGSADTYGLTGSGTFDGTGVFTSTSTFNAMGTVISSGRPVMNDYTVIGDGTSTVTLNLVGSPVLEGGVGAGGDVALWGGSTTDTGSPDLWVVLRAPASAGLGTLHGAYWVVLLERDVGSDDVRSLHGTLTADGAGGVTLLATSNTEGVLVAEPPQSTTYTVSPSGKLSVDAGGNLLAGAVTQDGRYATLAGGLAAGSNPTFVLLCRK